MYAAKAFPMIISQNDSQEKEQNTFSTVNVFSIRPISSMGKEENKNTKTIALLCNVTFIQ